MNIQVYQILHVLSGFLLVAVTFHAFAAPSPARRKSALMFAGIASLAMLVGGFGLAAKLQLDILKEHWIHVKFLCWLGLSAMTGLAFRVPGLVRVLAVISAVLVGVALYMVYVVHTAA